VGVGAGAGGTCPADKAEQGTSFARRIFQALTRRVPESRGNPRISANIRDESATPGTNSLQSHTF
jgi:hypothetical protein